MTIDPLFDLGLWHFAIATDASGNLTSNRFDVGGHPLSVHLLHVLDHGIQSFSEAAVLLSAAGHSPGDLDFLDFYDTPERRADAAAAR